jgi:signal transduction histidine kinase
VLSGPTEGRQVMPEPFGLAGSDVMPEPFGRAGRGHHSRDESLVNVADLAREMAPEGAQVHAPDEALIGADERLVALALRNLLENAEKYAQGAREVLVSREGARVRLAVRDNGPGLDAVARARMFDPHWRGSAQGPGRGLGLALVLAVAERYGGGAEAATGPTGRGLEVSMTFDGLVRWNEETT